jgi:hypothetical protein
MASNTNQKKQCSKCGSNGWVFPCEGCQASFCVKHAPEHRQELDFQLKHIQGDLKILQNIHSQHEECQDHPLLSQIDVWEQDTIAKINQTAQIARDELRKLIDESNDRKKKMFKEFHEQLQTGRQTEQYTEIELEQWKKQLIDIKNQMETPSDIELIPDKTVPPIELIKINVTKEGLLFSQPTQILEDSNSDIECSCDKTESSALESTIECENLQSESLERTTTSCSALRESIENNHLVVFQSSSDNQSPLLTILNQLTDHKMEIFNTEEECLNSLQCGEQATIFIDFFNRPLNEQDCFLDKISEMHNVYYMYIRGNPSEDDNERAEFFRRYSKIKAIFESEERLMVQWALDTANELRSTGDRYVEIGDKNKGRQYFEQGIVLYKRLSTYLNEKRRVR